MLRYVMLQTAVVACIAVAGDIAPAHVTGQCGRDDSSSVFVAHFMTPDSMPWPFDLTISNGTWIQRFDSVTYVCTAVPETATYTWVWRGNRLSVNDVDDIALPRGETTEFFFYAVNPDSVVPRARPYVLYQQKGADVTLEWTWDSLTSTLRWRGLGDTTKIANVGVFFETDLTQPPDWHLDFFLRCAVCEDLLRNSGH